MVTLKCHNCGREVEKDDPPEEYVCKGCGAVNVVPTFDGTGDAACTCLAPTSFEWQLPAGKLTGPKGPIYITAQGSHMTKAKYIESFGLDPDIALEYMRSGAAAKERDDDIDIGGRRRAK